MGNANRSPHLSRSCYGGGTLLFYERCPREKGGLFARLDDMPPVALLFITVLLLEAFFLFQSGSGSGWEKV